MVNNIEARLVIDAHDYIGEGPAWDAAAGRLLWSDNAVGVIHEARADAATGWREHRCWNLNRPLGAAIPRSRGGLIVAAGTEVLAMSEAGDVSLLVRLDADPNLVRVNEAKCDPQGRLWVGTATADYAKTGVGALYRVDPDGTVATVLRDITISNGMDWSPDYSTFYYVDSHTHRVAAFDFDASLGTLANRRTLATVEFGAGLPDGLTVDCEGAVWVAVIGSGEVRRYAPDGALLARATLSAPAVTSCAFGGPDGADLFITSAGVRLPDVARSYGISAEVIEHSPAAPGAGGVFVCRPGITGRPATAFAG